MAIKGICDQKSLRFLTKNGGGANETATVLPRMCKATSGRAPKMSNSKSGT